MAVQAAGFEVVTAADGAAGLELARRDDVAALIADVNMPLLDGFSLCRTLRQEGRDLPIVLLTSRDGEIDEALGLDLGADDYVTKPFSTRVLLARIKALLRRAGPAATDGEGDDQVLRRGPVRLDPRRLEVHVGPTRLQITVTEFRLLEALARRVQA